jgi:AcrR family transcriptional regulator
LGPRAEKKEQRRQELLTASLELFVSKGYDGTTVRDIAAKTGMGVSLLFHYFPTKQAILEELVTMAGTGVTAALKLLSAPLPPLKKFEQIAKTIFGAFDQPVTMGLFLLAGQVQLSAGIPKSVKRQLASYETIEISVRVIKQGQKTGEIRAGNPLGLALAFWGAVQGIAEMLVWYPASPIPDSQCLVDILRLK